MRTRSNRERQRAASGSRRLLCGAAMAARRAPAASAAPRGADRSSARPARTIGTTTRRASSPAPAARRHPLGELQPVDHRAHGPALRRAEAVVLQIEVVHDRGEPRDRRSPMPKSGTAFRTCSRRPVAELDAEHVERDAALRNGSRSAAKPNRAARSMKRRISHADAMRSTPGRGRVTHRRPLIRGRSVGPLPSAGEAPAACRPRRSLLELREQRHHAVAPALPKKSMRFEGDEALAKDVEQAADRGRARAGCRRVPSAALQRLFDVSRQRQVRVLTRAAELLHQRVVGPGVDVVRGEDARVAAGGLDLGLQPLEVLAAYRACRAARTPPVSAGSRRAAAAGARSDPEIGRLRRQLVNEQQPAPGRGRGTCRAGGSIRCRRLGWH